MARIKKIKISIDEALMSDYPLLKRTRKPFEGYVEDSLEFEDQSFFYSLHLPNKPLKLYSWSANGKIAGLFLKHLKTNAPPTRVKLDAITLPYRMFEDNLEFIREGNCWTTKCGTIIVLERISGCLHVKPNGSFWHMDYWDTNYLEGMNQLNIFSDVEWFECCSYAHLYFSDWNAERLQELLCFDNSPEECYEDMTWGH